ncbi:hypothetical protein SEA_ALLEYCAT_60 [Mycobacterium phage AlleyCat]|uniref:Uncharacterized protein n=4 Tax=Kratiovirus larva TaxID=1056831 RepID=A0A221J786_9CAUD|nr:hypothetical protein CL76_gp43 [Mycobacterium phage Larva]AEL19707.1 hypothetical protein LARVA_59 [Mycobacterium phage Larva]ASM62566.1 hypothetical protein SEA_ALLEYCAT_60 [Mycobacterium phage AlleyCat]QQV92661.1 hypothetical protein SEA_PSYCHO_58 [Mycobacterium phage Psycho]WAB09741.1 hypothetical protein SEA_DADOSKY_60 [Mycobacterium phage Dadosky]
MTVGMTAGAERSAAATHCVVADHYCTGDDCFHCERRISQVEYERDCYRDDDYPDYYDGT